MNNNIRKTSIVGTIGPASESEEMLTKLISEGLNVARINFSHGGYEENKTKIETIKKVREKLGKPVSLLLDTKGPEIRTGLVTNGNDKIEIKEGQTFTFVTEEIMGDNTKVSITYADLYKDVQVGSNLLVDDGALEFEIVSIEGSNIVCRALNTGKLGNRKTINVPGVKLELPALTSKDIDDITSGIKAGFDYIAASFVRKASDVKEIRDLLNSNGGEKIKIISKIENREGIDNFDEILEVSDGIMVARGDMGVEIPMAEVPIVQKIFIKKCTDAGKPVITATQMLESMIQNPRPTRAEVSDVANAVYDMTGAVMLSGECALGKYPVECVEAMDNITRTVEKNIKYWKRFNRRGIKQDDSDLEKSIAYATCVTSEQMKAEAIVAYTHKGDSIRKLSGLRPGCPIFAITDDEKTFNQLALSFGVFPIYAPSENIDETIKLGLEKLKEEKYLDKGDVVILSGGDRVLDNGTENKMIGAYVKI